MHLDHAIVLDFFKDYDFRIMDIFIDYCSFIHTLIDYSLIYSLFIVLTQCGMEAFPINFLVKGGFLLADSLHRFSDKKPGRMHVISVWRVSRYGEISLCFALCLFVYLFIGSCISYVV